MEYYLPGKADGNRNIRVRAGD
uniref:Uncharacterized protein n=1 Tax=Anguilla anguilla TaxID=7936 RepID=A0A0E9P975_ANGAN